ncbi:MAG TPA: alpha-L-fucosidase, partial [Rhizomicrobium sp.]|nr:alpha-L-fucosidase [Rhizomicrobium sp.]
GIFSMPYDPTLASLNTHPVPAWYDDAKFGIFIHWGLYSIPAFASRFGTIGEVFRDRYDTAVAETPYTEWYCNAIKVPESESAKHHREVWHGAPYQDFRKPFLEGLEQWSPRDWADAFADAGARYVVLVTKHHDGYCLWPSQVKNPNQDGWTTERDIVGELAEAVRAKGMRFGVYYSGGIDWTFNPLALRTLGNFVGSTPAGSYPAYADAQLRELIERYRPSVVWNDISWPTTLQPELDLYAHYYNAVPDVVVNDRWMPVTWQSRLMRTLLVQKIFDWFAKRYLKKNPVQGITPPAPPHCDFRTPEYTTFATAQAKKWEATRGMSFSFGYNARDTDADFIGVESLVTSFIDTVSKNGNLLLNVGPRGVDARIPDPQLVRLKGFGAWMRENGEGITGTRPWTRAEGVTGDGTQVRYTCKPDATRTKTLYAFVLGRPDALEFLLEGADLPAIRRAVHLSTGCEIGFRKMDNGIVLKLPQPLLPSPAHGFELELE